jgi:hypothetical protein
MFAINSTNEEKVLISLNPTTAAGNPAPVDGAPVWNVTSGDCTLEVAADGLSCYLISGAADVINTVEVSADANMGEEVLTITETVVYTVTAAQAAALGINSEVLPK